MTILGLNTLDLLILVIILIGMLIGMARGVVPQIISIVSFWLSLVVTLWLYKAFSFRILQGLGMGETAADVFAFLIVITVVFQTVRILVSMLMTPPEDKKKKKKSQDDPLAEAAKSASQRFILGPINLLGGGFMGIVLSILWLAIFLGVAQFLFQPTDLPAGVGATTRRMAFQLDGSLLLGYFNYLLWLLVQSLNLFTPSYADILRKVVLTLF